MSTAFLYFIMLFPFRTDRNLKRVPYVTYGIIFLNIIIYLSTLSLSSAELYAVNLQYGFVLSSFKWYSLITYGFLHGGLEHLLGNMFLLWIAGTVLESAIGRARFTFLYFGSSIVAALLNALAMYYMLPASHYGIPLIGASGAISGVIGFAAFRYYYIKVQSIIIITLPLPFLRTVIPLPIPYLIWVPFWVFAAYFFLREILLGFFEKNTNVAHFAHIGGLLLGIILALMVRSYRDGLREATIEGITDDLAEKDGKEINKTVTSLLKENPDDPELLVTEAGIKVIQEKTDEAETMYIKALDLAIKQGKYATALVCYENLLEINSNSILSPRTYLALFTLYEKENNLDRMKSIFDIVFSRYSKTGAAESMLIKMANYYAGIEKYKDRAALYYETLIKNYPMSNYADIAKNNLKKLGY